MNNLSSLFFYSKPRIRKNYKKLINYWGRFTTVSIIIVFIFFKLFQENLQDLLKKDLIFQIINVILILSDESSKLMYRFLCKCMLLYYGVTTI